MDTLFTANFPRSVIETRFPFELTHKDWLISISDAAGWAPRVRDPFDKVFEFFFDDETSPSWPGIMQEEQAADMARIILDAKEKQKNVWVHCTAGMCRSGAVVEILGLLGWTICDDLSPMRIPNAHVFKTLRMQFPELRNSWELDDKMAEKWNRLIIVDFEDSEDEPK